MAGHLPHTDPDQNEDPCMPLDQKATIVALRIVSTSALTMIATLSAYSSEIVAPLARWELDKELLSISPYPCITLALIGAAFSFCASESNGLAECASIAVLLVCLSGILLGASAVAIIFPVAPLALALCADLLIIILIFGWGWLLTYPRCLKFFMRVLFWACFDQRRSTNPFHATYGDRRPGQRTDKKGFREIICNILASCRRAFLPLDEDSTIDIMKALSPSILTAISAISLWAAHTVAPNASVTVQKLLFALPFGYLPLGLATIFLAVSATKSNGLMSYASSLALVLCLFGVALGVSCSTVVLHYTLIPTLLVANLLVLLIIGWGWIFAYPKMLNLLIRKTICIYWAKRLGIDHSGGFDVCGGISWAYIFAFPKAICINMLLVLLSPFIIVVLCLRRARRWWHSRHAVFFGVDLDLEAGASGIELLSIGVLQSDDHEAGAEEDNMLIPEVARMTI